MDDGSNHVDAHIGGNVAGENVAIGNHNVINNYYSIVEKNTEKHEPDYWALKHPYPMPPNFTGRVKERATLTHWLKDDAENRLFILCALGGFGKSALSWHWLTHDVDEKEFPKALWWSFYEGDASFEHFVEETLKYLNCEAPQGKRAQIDELLKAMQVQKILLILDGFERVLRLYASMNAAYQGDEESEIEDNHLDCTDINAEWFLKGVCSLPKMQSKVLMTTRLTPRAVKPRDECLQGCREVELTAMDKADAVLFFQRQQIKGTHAEVEAACEPYGYHPLSLRILAGFIANDRENPNDIKVAESLDITNDIIQNKNHVLKVAYDALSFGQQKLLGNIACLRSHASYHLLKDISNRPSWKREHKKRVVENLDFSLQILESRGLLIWDRKRNIYNLHPIVRRYAYDRLTAAERTGAHERLVNYFAAIPKPKKVEKLEDLAHIIELYHHMIGAGNLDEAKKIFKDRLDTQTYYQFGAYQLQIKLLRSLFPDGEDKPPRLKTKRAQSLISNDLANAYSHIGQPGRAVVLFQVSAELDNSETDKENLAIVLGNVAGVQLEIGALDAAEHNLRDQIDLCSGIADEYIEAYGHHELAHVLSYCGKWPEAENEQDQALTFAKKLQQAQAQSSIWSYRALHFLLMTRDVVNNGQLSLKGNQLQIENLKSSIQCAQRAFELANEFSRTDFRLESDYVRAYWLLGAAYRANNELTLAEGNLFKALNLCRQINLVEFEADILLDLARLRYAQGDFKDTQEKAAEALMITERCGYVLQGADVHLFLTTLAEKGYKLEDDKALSDKDAALLHAREALKLATCDGPPYYYKVAYEEAEQLIARLSP